MNKDDQATIANNWLQSFSEDPEQTRTVVRNMLQESRNRQLVRAALKNRANRWMLKRAGSLEIVETELQDAEEKARQEQKGI